jgi:hypothetical protein
VLRGSIPVYSPPGDWLEIIVNAPSIARDFRERQETQIRRPTAIENSLRKELRHIKDDDKDSIIIYDDVANPSVDVKPSMRRARAKSPCR